MSTANKHENMARSLKPDKWFGFWHLNFQIILFGVISSWICHQINVLNHEIAVFFAKFTTNSKFIAFDQQFYFRHMNQNVKKLMIFFWVSKFVLEDDY